MAKKKTSVKEPVIENEVLEEVAPVAETETTQEETAPEANEEPVEENDTILTVEETQEIMNEFSEASKKVDEAITATSTQEEIKQILESELSRVDEAEKKITENIMKASKKINNNFANYWNGTSDGWYN